jgi:large subunit ribosomal protein L4
MASNVWKSSSQSLKWMARTIAVPRDPLMVRANPLIEETFSPQQQCLTPRFSRSMATETQFPKPNYIPVKSSGAEPPIEGLSGRRPPPQIPDVLVTVYQFPTMEPLHFTHYPANHLNLPLRRDILHRAVIFEGDAARQGTASTKWRDDVHGSGRKIRPQKGSGRARLGDKKSPMLKGGGVAFGPHPRDFSTKFPRKMYDLAWRTALSYRYKRGELVVVDNHVDIEMNEPRWVKKIMERNHWGNADGRSLVVTRDVMPNLFQALDGCGEHGRVRKETDVDVKNLLEFGRIIIDKRALDSILRNHSSDLYRTVPCAVY